MRLRSVVTTVFIGLVAVTFGCKDEDKGRLLFEHAPHVKEQEIGCLDCHGPLEKGRYRKAGHDDCLSCHGELIETREIAKETCGTCHDVEDLEKIGEGKEEILRRTAGKGIFIHTEDTGKTCTECHENVPDDPERREYALSDRRLLSIRNKSHETDRPCAACHENLNRDTPPRSHRENWKKGHGTFGSQDGTACKVCHRDNSCQECHRVEKPSSHSSRWLANIHGTEGGRTNSTCQVCHKPDFCTSCHQEMRPRSHNAQWGATHGPAASDPASCRKCHTADSCQACHRETRPRSHNAQWGATHGTAASDPVSCRKCHTADSCQACHRETRPRSHNGLWKERHCLSCHPQGSNNGCLVCHKEGLSRHPSARIEHRPRPEPCLACHDPVAGRPGQRLNPRRHPLLSPDTCLSCHRY